MLIMLHGACVWHRMAVCSAHGYAGSIASPGGGPLPFWACSTAPARMAVAAATGAAAWALPWQWLVVVDPPLALCSLSGTSLGLAPDPVRHHLSHTRARARCLHYWAACWAELLRVHISAVQRWSICTENRKWEPAHVVGTCKNNIVIRKSRVALAGPRSAAS